MNYLETHELFKDGDENIPEQILDRNGTVCLRLCKICNKGEIELYEPCEPKIGTQ